MQHSTTTDLRFDLELDGAAWLVTIPGCGSFAVSFRELYWYGKFRRRAESETGLTLPEKMPGQSWCDLLGEALLAVYSQPRTRYADLDESPRCAPPLAGRACASSGSLSQPKTRDQRGLELRAAQEVSGESTRQK
jgi:hypothetical protein